MLCEICIAMFSGDHEGPTWPPMGTHHTSAQALNEACRNDCHFCNLLRHELQKGGSIIRSWLGYNEAKDTTCKFQGPAHLEYYYIVGSTGLNLTLSLEWRDKTFADPRICVDFFFSRPQVRKPMLDTHSGELPIPSYSNPTFGSEICSRTDDPHVWRLARHWLENCFNGHDKCRSSKTDRWYPSRLIYIGADKFGRSNDADVNLHISGLDTATSSYMTLSHCWGDPTNAIQLTSQTFDAMKKRIQFSHLPATFRDAIRFARFCGVDYIWIDSLCIIQDSWSDWDKESTAMSDVYKNSYCNINATASASSDGGCFFDRDPTSIIFPPIQLGRKLIDGMRIDRDPPIQLGKKIIDGVRNTQAIVASYAVDTSICVPHNLWQWNVEEAPLNQRAWVLQERLLSPRQIHCCSDQLFWQCREHRACDAFPTSMPDDLEDAGFYRKPRTFGNTLSGDFTNLCTMVDQWKTTERMAEERSHNTENQSLERLTAPNLDVAVHKRDFPYSPEPSSGIAVPDRSEQLRRVTEDIYDSWRDFVLKYSTCALTYSTDKLVAIRGLIRYIQEAGLDQNVAGLWRRRLPSELLWSLETSNYKTFAKRPLTSEQRTPTEFPGWSWASVEVPVRPYERANNAEPIVHILDLQFPLDSSIIAGHRWLGTLPLGIVRMRGHLFSGSTSKTTWLIRGETQEVTIQIDLGPGERKHRMRNWLSGTIPKVLSPASRHKQERTYVFRVGKEKHRLILRPTNFDSGEFPKTLTFFPLVFASKYENEENFFSFDGLLLHPVGRDCFRRIGTLDVGSWWGENCLNQTACTDNLAHVLIRHMKSFPDEGKEITLI